MAEQTRYPTGDGITLGTITVEPTTPTTKWDKVDEVTPDDYSTYLTEVSGSGYQQFTFAVFDIVASAITDITIYYRAAKQASQTANVAAGLVVNGTFYNSVDSGVDPPNGSFTTYSYSFTTNPDTASAWLQNDINGSGSNPLEEFGVMVNDGNPDVDVTACWAVVTYTPGAIIKTLAGQSDGVGVVSAIPAMVATREVIGSSAGVATVDDIPAMTAIRVLAGASDGGSTAAATVITSIPTNLVDTYVRHDSDTTNYGSSQQLIVFRDWSNSFSRVSLMRWDFSYISAGTIDTALLSLYAYQDDTASINVYCQHIESVGQAFTEAGATWMTYDGTNGWDGGSDIGSADATTTNEAYDTSTGANNHWFEWDIVDMIQHAVDNHGGILEIAIVTKQTGNGNFYFYTKEYGTESLRPKLEITFSTGATELLAGTADGVAVVSDIPAMQAIRECVGVSNGVATVSDIPELKVSLELGGASDGVATVSSIPALKVSYDLVLDQSNGLSTVGAAVKVTKEFIGLSAGVGAHSPPTELKVTKEFIGATDGLSTVNAVLTCTWLLVGVTDGLSTVGGVLDVLKAFIGTSDGVSTAAASLTKAIAVTGQSDGTSVVANIPALKAIRELVGISDGVGIVAAFLLKSTAPLGGASDGTSTVSATIRQLIPLAGATDGTSLCADLLLKAACKAAGASDGTSTADATVKCSTELVCTSDGTSTVGSVLEITKKLSGASDGDSDAGASIAGDTLLGGASDGLSTAGVLIKVTKTVVGVSDGSSTASAVLTSGAEELLAGQSDGISTAAIAGMTAIKTFVGGADGSATTVVGVNIVKGLNGFTDGLSTVNGAISSIQRLVGAAAGISTVVSVSMTRVRTLTGTTNGTATAQATLRKIVPLTGTTNGTSTTTLSLAVDEDINLVGSSAGIAAVSCSMVDVPYHQRGSIDMDTGVKGRSSIRTIKRLL